MKRSLSLRALNGKPYTIDIEPNATIYDLKCAVAAKILANHASITLILHSHILSDGTLISSLKMESENDFIVIHVPYAPPVISSPQFIVLPDTATRQISGGISLKQTLPPKPLKKEQRTFVDIEQENKIRQIAEVTNYNYTNEEMERMLAEHSGDVETTIRSIFMGREPVAEAPRPSPPVIVEKPKKPKKAMVDLSELSRINFGQFAGLMSDYSMEDKVNLLTLIQRHRDLEVTYLLQMFHACDRILEAVEHNLAAFG